MRSSGAVISKLSFALVVLFSAGVQAREPFESTYVVRSADAFVVRNVSAYIGDGSTAANVDVLVRNGRIVEVGADIAAPEVREIDGAYRWLTPGVIDVHSHLGNYPAPAVTSTQDGNEMVSPNTAQVWAEHSVWPQDPQFALALAGGVTTLHILPGSANLFGGRGVTLKNVPSRSVQGMKFPGAKHSLKMACGENPKRVYGGRNQAPSTRMGNVAGYRAAWIKAAAYRDKMANEDEEKHPERDLMLDTLAGVLDGEIIVHNHCYRADEMINMIDIAQEFGYTITAFHHAVESYKIADVLAEQNICSALWTDWWGFKLEAFDGIPENLALVEQAGACAIVHSDSARGIQRLNQEAAKAWAAASRRGIELSAGTVWQWISLNAAQALGIDEETGSIEAGKAADLVLWDRDPLSVYARTEMVWIDGALYHERAEGGVQPRSDFDLGQTPRGDAR